MLYADFWWDCPSCKKTNRESFANEDDHYSCSGCKRKFYLTFSVEVEEIEAYNEEKDIIEPIVLVTIEISHDSGETWREMQVNTRDLNPETSPLKPGDWLRYNGRIWKVFLNETQNRLNTVQLKTQPNGASA